MVEAPNISERIEQAPWWLPCVLSFACGVAVTAAVLMPIASTPDYLRGRDDGYSIGLKDGNKQLYDVGHRDGQAGRYIEP